jgi:hypothetical protein
MRVISANDVTDCTLRGLGLQASVRNDDWEPVVAGMLRRTAGFFCPCPARTLLDAVRSSASPLATTDLLDCLGDVLGDLITCGDLVELTSTPGSQSSSTLYLAPPSFIPRKSGRVYLQGVVPDHPVGLEVELGSNLEVRGVARSLPPNNEPWGPILTTLGFTELNPDNWFGAPSPTSARNHLAEYDARLRIAPGGGDTSALEVITPDSDLRYYRGRWAPAGNRRGRFVGKRSQKYGSPIWCYAEIADGRILHLLDVTGDDNLAGGHNEGWHLQMALDACSNRPQVFSLSACGSAVAINLFSPIPRWAERRFETLGVRERPGGGALFTITIGPEELDEEVNFLRRSLWLEQQG